MRAACIFAAVALFSALFCLGAPPAGVAVAQPKSGMQPWPMALKDAAASLGVHMVVEADDRVGVPGSLLDLGYVSPPATRPTDTAAFLIMVQEWFPVAEVKYDRTDPHLLRVYEKSLSDLNGMSDPLDSKVTLQYSGTLDGLIARAGGVLVEAARGVRRWCRC